MDSGEEDDLFFDSDSETDYEVLPVADADDGKEDKQENYKVWREEDIRSCIEDDVIKVSSVLSVSREFAALLLVHFKWNINKLHEEWFSDEQSVRRAVGLLEKPSVGGTTNSNELNCGICFEIYSLDEISSVACGHSYCNTCWECYLTTSINDGLSCLTLKCPDPSCNAAVGVGMIDHLVSDEYKEKYRRYGVRSLVEGNRSMKWCPAPGCDYAVEFIFGSGNYDVICGCLNEFCWNCLEDAHRPLDCDTVAKWIVKNNVESENTNWILAFTKPCPECKRPIEKNDGCMRMTCRPPCKHMFCWLCLQPWSVHGYATCNGYKESEIVETENKRDIARRHLVRYTHYYERWAANEKSEKKALKDLSTMETVHLLKLSQIQSQTEADLKFVLDAWHQIVQCRRVLKWTYSYGYYIPENEYNKRQFFEYIQGEAEAGLERLHQCAEKELEKYYCKKENTNQNDFNNYRGKLVNLTIVTRNYFQNLVRALENGLADVDSGGCDSKRKSSDNAAESSSMRPSGRKKLYKEKFSKE